MDHHITICKPQVVRRKPVMKAKGSSLRRGGHRALHLDELPTPATRSRSNSYGITEVRCTAKAFFKWASCREGSVEIVDGAKTVLTLPLRGQDYKQFKQILVMLRKTAQSPLTMRHVL